MADVPPYLPASLTPQQLEAILHHGSPLLIIAGPGSGKTEVISWRTAHLILDGQAEPRNLLVTTFTNKAALELKDRIQRKLPHINVELMHVSTMHSFCAALLREHEDRSPLGGPFSILDEAGQFLFVFSHRKQLGLSEIVKGREHAFYSEIVNCFNLATEEMVEPDELEAFCTERKTCACEDEADLWTEWATVAHAYQTYCDLLREHRLADFASLQRYALEMLREHPDVLDEVRSRFSDVLIDEYQDTNALQDRIMDLIVGNDGQGLTVVGDDDQALYRFRGATVKNILDFTKQYPQAHTVRLDRNFRSYEKIVDHSLSVIVNNPARFDKDLFTKRGPGNDILLSYEHDAKSEAEAVVDLLCRLRSKDLIQRWSDVAILLRSVRSHAGPYLEALREASVPHTVTGEGSFFEREEIEGLWQLVSFLGAGKPWGDRFVRRPIMGLHDETIAALKSIKDDLTGFESGAALTKAGISDTVDLGRLLWLVGLKQRVQAEDYDSLLEVFHWLLTISGAFARYERGGQSEALRNLGVFSQLVANYDTHGRSQNFHQLMAYLKLLKEGGLDPITEPPEDAVQVMTIHQAKGLEFPVVVLGAAMEGRLPVRRRSSRYEIPYDMRASGEPEVDDPHIVDERRLFYVAATRARDLLIIGTADVVNKRGGGPSRFLFEMFGDNLQTVADVSAAYVKRVESRDPGEVEPRRRHSFSQIAYYLQCPLRYKYSTVYGMQTPAPDPHNFGANVHRALRVIHEDAMIGEVPPLEDVPEIVRTIWLSGPRARPEEEEVLKQRASAQIQNYLTRHEGDLARVESAERDFAFPINGHVLAGRIDLVRRMDEGGVEIVDFKTGHSSPIAAEQIDTQLELYAFGVTEDLKLDVRREMVHFLGDNVTQSWSWSEEGARRARELLTEMLGKIEAGEFARRPIYCSRCDEFRALCPSTAGVPGRRD